MAALNALPSVRDGHTCPPCNAVWDGHTLPKLRLGNSSTRNVVWSGHRLRNRSIMITAKEKTKTKTDETGTYKCADLDHHHLTNGFPLAFPNEGIILLELRYVYERMVPRLVSLRKRKLGKTGNILKQMSTIDKSSNIVWHQCSIGKPERQQLLQQKGCVIWITGLSGSGKSTVACALSRSLHSRGKLTYVLDGDNVRHGLNKDLSFGPEDRAENIRRIGEAAKLFSDAGLICIASLISPYKRDRDACRALLPKGDFIEVFMDVPLHICEARDPKGLYKLARAGKIKGFTGIDDPYEQPQNCEIVLRQKPDSEITPYEMAETVVSYLEEHGYLQA